MRKAIYEPRYQLAVRLMREARQEANITQEKLATALGRTPEQISKWERCQRRLDLRDLDDYLSAIGVDVVAFVAKWKAASQTLADGDCALDVPAKQRRARPKTRGAASSD
jgi:transcriptional regulator with XRE-family HTH domain